MTSAVCLQLLLHLVLLLLLSSTFFLFSSYYFSFILFFFSFFPPPFSCSLPTTSPSSCSSFPSSSSSSCFLLLFLVLLRLLLHHLLLPPPFSCSSSSQHWRVRANSLWGMFLSSFSKTPPKCDIYNMTYSGITRAILGHYSGISLIQHYGSVPWHATRWLCLTSRELLHLFTFKCHFERSPSSSLFSSWNLNMQFRWCGFRNTYFFGLNRSISGKHFIWSPYLSDFYELHFKMFQPANQHKIILYWIFRNISELQNHWSFCEELYFCVDFGFRVPVFGPFHQES